MTKSSPSIWHLLHDVKRWRFCQFLWTLKFLYSVWEGHKICEIFTLLLSLCTADKSKANILQNFVASSEYTNFKWYGPIIWHLSSFSTTFKTSKNKKIALLILTNNFIEKDLPYILMTLDVVEIRSGGNIIWSSNFNWDRY